MIRVRTASRLHFGLLNLACPEAWFNRSGEATLAARQFGGAGLMVEEPGIELTARPALTWTAEGPLADRVLAYARCFAQSLPPGAAQPQHFVLDRTAPEHAGLGTGTQLGLAVGRAVAVAAGMGELDVMQIAQRLGRGQRSAIGIHGFAQGGFLVDGGKRSSECVAPLVARVAMPEQWRVLIFLPRGAAGIHGVNEREAFERLRTCALPPHTTESLCRLVLLGMLPALHERDLEAFGEAIYDYNTRVGEAFAPIQGAIYAGSLIKSLVAFLRQQGVRGVGQSSWGPAVFALVADETAATHLRRAVQSDFSTAIETAYCTRACNRGAAIELLGGNR